MTVLTAVLALICSVLVLNLKPIQGFSIYLAAFVWYPQPLTVSLGTIDFSLGRVVIIVFLMSLLLRGEIRRFRWSMMDSLVMLYLIGRIFALSHTVPANVFLEREGGDFVDTVFPYFAARIVIYDKERLLIFIKSLAYVAVPLAFLGMYQSVTGHNPVAFLERYYSWGLDGPTAVLRRGNFYRANGTFTIHIIFGLFFAGIAPLVTGLYGKGVLNNRIVIILTVIVMLGALSSMSSAPLFALVTSMFILAVFPFQKYTRIFLIAFVCLAIFLEFYSNRHWYEVMTRFAYNSRTASYRIGLYNEAFGGGMTGHWLFGFGYVGVGSGSVNNSLFNWEYQDLVNIYIHQLVNYGLSGVIFYLAMNVYYYLRIYIAYQIAQTVSDKWLIWTLMASLIGWNLAMMTVAALGQVGTLLFIFMAIAYNLKFIFQRSSPDASIEPQYAETS